MSVAHHSIEITTRNKFLKNFEKTPHYCDDLQNTKGFHFLFTTLSQLFVVVCLKKGLHF